jgi:hypothetical protein
MALKYKDKSMASAESVKHIIYNSQLVHELKQGDSIRWEETAGTYETGALPEYVSSLTCYRDSRDPSIGTTAILSSGATLYNNDTLRFSATSSSQYYSVTVPTGTYTVSTLYNYQVEKTYSGVTLSGVYASPIMRNVACNKSTPATGVTSYVVSYYTSGEATSLTTKTVNVSGALGTMIIAFSGKTVSWSSPVVSSGYKLLQTSGNIAAGTSSATIAPECYAYDWYDIWHGFSGVSKTMTQSSGYTARMTDLWAVGGINKYERVRVSGTVVITASNNNRTTVSFENVEVGSSDASSLGTFTIISLAKGGLSGNVLISKYGYGFLIYTTNTWTGTDKAKLTSMTVKLTSVQVYVPFDLSNEEILHGVWANQYDIYADVYFMPCDVYVIGDIEWSSSVLSTQEFTKADSVTNTDVVAGSSGAARAWIMSSIAGGQQEDLQSADCYIALTDADGTYMVSTMYNYTH